MTQTTPSSLVVGLARELYDRFVMGGWEPQDSYDLISKILSNRWQLIETAPKDETVFVTRFPASTRPPIVPAWLSDSKNTREMSGMTCDWRVSASQGKLLWFVPTHWMKIPELPNA